MSLDMEKKMNAFTTSCYRIIINIKRLNRVTNNKLYTMTNTQPLPNTRIGHIPSMFHHMDRDTPEDKLSVVPTEITRGDRRQPDASQLLTWLIDKPGGGVRRFTAASRGCMRTEIFFSKNLFGENLIFTFYGGNTRGSWHCSQYHECYRETCLVWFHEWVHRFWHYIEATQCYRLSPHVEISMRIWILQSIERESEREREKIKGF